MGNGGTLTYAVETNPAHGTLSGTAPHLTYTPNAGYFGPDSFTFEVVYGAADAVAMVDITVNKLNHPPVADDQAVFTNEDNAKGITLSASDIDGDALSYRVMDDPAHGTLSGVAPDLVYTPAADFNGSDSFTFIANDGEMDSDVATVTIVVAAVNDIPVAVDDAIAMLRKTTVNIPVLANDWDVDGDSLAVTEVSPSSHGGLVTITADGAGVSYTPLRNFTGQDIFTYTVSDGCGGIAS
ncbi:MAG: Ig-like domain-containing protein, partial [Desulfuromonadaceae bacterium]